LNGLQQSLIAGAIRQNSDNPSDPILITQSAAQAKGLRTYEDALNCLHPDAP
jgi:hypothetical protein